MDNLTSTKAAIVAAVGTIWAMFGPMGPLLGVLLFGNIADYITGVVYAWQNGELSSSIAFRGAVKKVFYWATVAVAWCVDTILINSAPSLGINVAIPAFLVSIVIVWLDLTELLSITENLGKLGVPIPPFLKRAISEFKNKIDEMNKEDK